MRKNWARLATPQKNSQLKRVAMKVSRPVFKLLRLEVALLSWGPLASCAYCGVARLRVHQKLSYPPNPSSLLSPLDSISNTGFAVACDLVVIFSGPSCCAEGSPTGATSLVVGTELGLAQMPLLCCSDLTGSTVVVPLDRRVAAFAALFALVRTSLGPKGCRGLHTSDIPPAAVAAGADGGCSADGALCWLVGWSLLPCCGGGSGRKGGGG